MSVGSRIGDDLVEKTEIAVGFYMAENLFKVNKVHIITNILNIREQEVELHNHVVKW